MPNFRGNEDLCKLGKEYLNDLLCKFGPFCLQHSKVFDISHAFLWVTVAELSTLKQVQFFWPTLYMQFFAYFHCEQQMWTTAALSHMDKRRCMQTDVRSHLCFVYFYTCIICLQCECDFTV